jgi:hypothetical protein
MPNAAHWGSWHILNSNSECGLSGFFFCEEEHIGQIDARAPRLHFEANWNSRSFLAPLVANKMDKSMSISPTIFVFSGNPIIFSNGYKTAYYFGSIGLFLIFAGAAE